MSKYFLEHRPGKDGDIKKFFPSFNREINKILAEERWIFINEIFEAMPDVLQEPMLSSWVERIRKGLPDQVGPEVRIDYFYDFEGIPLTLDLFLMALGEKEGKPNFVGVGYELYILIGVASKIAFNKEFTREEAISLFHAGITAESYAFYAKKHREESIESTNEVSRGLKEKRKEEALTIAKEISIKSPNLNLTGLYECVATEYESKTGQRISVDTIKTYLKNSELIDKHRDSRGKRPSR